MSLNQDFKECSRHGKYESKTTKLFNQIIQIGCPQCIEEAERLESTKKANEDSERRISALQGLGIGKRYYESTFDSFIVNQENKEVFEICKKYADNQDKYRNGNCLLMIGKVGTGKTHLAVSILLSEYDKRVKYISVMRMIREIRSTYRSVGNEQAEINRFIDYDLLILDELGVQLGTESERILIFEVINGRYDSMKPTVFISNLNLKSLTEYTGERVIDRIRQGGQIAVFNWDSYRGKK